MIDAIETFAELLRQNGVRVSTGEVIDAARAVAAVGVDRAQDVRAALAAALVKRAGDRAAFDELFDLYFLRGAALASRGSPLVDALRAAGIPGDAIEHIVAHLATEAAHLGAVARVGLGLRAPAVSPLVRAAGLQGDLDRMVSPLQAGFFAHRVAQALDLRGAQADIDAVLARLVGSAQGLSPEVIERLRAFAAANLDALRRAIRDYVQDEFRRRNLDYLDQVAARTLADKPLAQLTDREVAELRAEVARLARILRARVQLAPKRRRRGRLDVRKTLRGSLATGGVPVSLELRHRPRKKPRLVVLCDVSDSVRTVSRFMLQFVYALQELFDRVHTFAFVAELGELTDLFRRHDLDRAVELTYQGAVVNVYANSNYGHVLDQFCARHMSKVTPRTTVLVIGDGRNNYHPSNHAALGDIRRRAKQLWWLNPEAPSAWGFGDSAMREYAPHCDRVVVAHNLDSLRKVVDELVM
ncbi:MAG: VWA domain-containing protein [Deltaproteobacteria bacterium]|nr:MAG: VWA domain-containing protein [Deltaproteobacteria bacterium]